ncbi:MAG: hypothetical protein NCW75_01640 [Phycisphaera sp.]|nr:MAG: hypothetical protein NCW75_01640 [Phycisphaera sp.]
MKFAFIGLGGVVALWLAFGALALNADGVLCWLGYDAASTIEPGTFGDMFGAGNAFFSALAFAAVAYTLWLQLQELEEARLDRREAREDSKENIKLQGEIAESQRSATQMQLKVAQSGDVYATYARVAGSEFMERLQRLQWIASANVDFVKQNNGIRYLFAPQTVGDLLYHNHRGSAPNHYSAGRIPKEELYAAGSSPVALADRVIADVRYCISALVDLQPLLKLELMTHKELGALITREECAFLTECAIGCMMLHGRQLQTIAELIDSIDNQQDS